MSNDDEGLGSLSIVRTLAQVQTEEAIGGIQEIRRVREKLGQFTLRDMTEAVMGSSEFADIVLSEDEGNTLMSDVKIEYSGDSAGNLIARVRDTGARQLTHEQQERATQIAESRMNENTPEAQARRLAEYNRQMKEEEAESAKGLTPEEMAQLKALLAKMT